MLLDWNAGDKVAFVRDYGRLHWTTKDSAGARSLYDRIDHFIRYDDALE